MRKTKEQMTKARIKYIEMLVYNTMTSNFNGEQIIKILSRLRAITTELKYLEDIMTADETK